MTNEVRHRSIRILFDLQACQTLGSSNRGVGNYSANFFSHAAAIRGQRDLFGLLGRHLPSSDRPTNADPARIVRYSLPTSWPSPRDFFGGEADSLDALSISAFIAPLKSDVVHISHAFEGLGERVPLPSFEMRAFGQLYTATLYDLIPLIFHQHYFKDEAFRKWYFFRLEWLRRADLLLAISESTRQDAIRLLGIEPWRIVTVHGGIAPQFRKLSYSDDYLYQLKRRHGLKNRIILYTGGDDHRKNLTGAIGGFASIPRELRQDAQLVVVCSIEAERKKMYLDSARTAGLAHNDVVFTGFLSETELVALYNICDLFVFPSLYEGLGLPVLEAMACGAPVIGANNSSVRELIGRSDALFDASSEKSIGEAIAHSLANPAFTDDLRNYGLARSPGFTWEKTAQIALDAFDEALSRSRHQGIQCATAGWFPRKLLAIFTPLPPSRSGIADYDARFLPYLARHFAIDLYVDNYAVEDDQLNSTFRIFNASEFPNVAKNYDAVLYEFGNSEFHAFMLPMLEKFPGVVGLHDAYLSGLFGYIDFALGHKGSYAKEMIFSHGTAARRLFAPGQKHPDPNGAAMIELPCTKKVLDLALGVISHSPFNLDLARYYYPEGWQAPYRIIPQMVEIPGDCSQSRRSEIRQDMGFGEDDFVISTFGHIAWTKCGERLLEAFLGFQLQEESNVVLVYVGELANDDFGRRLNESVVAAKTGKRIRITGFVSEEIYEQYLRCADIGIQLRINSRGGTPKGVLDCLAFGVPVIVNSDASYTDYPDDVVVKLSPNPSSNEIAQAISGMYRNPEKRNEFVRRGLQYVRDAHNPAACAAAYAAAINEFAARDQYSKPGHTITEFATHFSGCANVDSTVDLVAASLSESSYKFRRPRLLVDVSHIAQNDHQTGIPRVVKNTVRNLYCSKYSHIEPMAVELVDGKLHLAASWLEKQELLTFNEVRNRTDLEEFKPGDVILMLDSSWARYHEFFPIFERAQRAGATVLTAVYDLLPVTLPSSDVVKGGREWFEGWLQDALKASDGIVCISKAVSDEVNSFLDTLPEVKHRPKIAYWHLGSDFLPGEKADQAPFKHMQWLTGPYLLMVGTIEPRKRHSLALEAMEKLWAEGHDLSLCIAGKEGWLTSELMAKLRTHPSRDKKLFLLEDPSDGDIAALYRNASGLLFISRGEGFGLPMVEAADYGIPIICSEIPVFREIAGEFATYVPTDDAAVLARELLKWWDLKRRDLLPDTRAMPRLTWQESADDLLEVIIRIC